MKKSELYNIIKQQVYEYTGTGASGGNSTDGNDIASPRPFPDDKSEIQNYISKGYSFSKFDQKDDRLPIQKLAEEFGVSFKTNQNVKKIIVKRKSAVGIVVNEEEKYYILEKDVT